MVLTSLKKTCKEETFTPVVAYLFTNNNRKFSVKCPGLTLLVGLTAV